MQHTMSKQRIEVTFDLTQDTLYRLHALTIELFRRLRKVELTPKPTLDKTMQCYVDNELSRIWAKHNSGDK